jgi:formate dehydrogenase iron-sulfur subunit
VVASRENFPLLAELLAEQQRLDTPVARFSSAHDAGAASASFKPQLIPLTAPRAGEQYAFEVDLDACTGCKSCVAACHSLNGLDDSETWRDVGLLLSPSRAQPFTQTVTTACHHCADPACLNGCPVLAYEKDPLTGIVRHLDDQCIGCSYCVLKCPYDVPKPARRRRGAGLRAGVPDACHPYRDGGRRQHRAPSARDSGFRLHATNDTLHHPAPTPV